jgi:nucleoside-diphosphate-sugar epimerase
LFRGQSQRPYNVGSEADLTIRDLAHEVARCLAPGTPIQIAQAPTPGRPPERYVPSTQRAQVELGLQASVDLAEAIQRTAQWWKTTHG